MISYKTITCRGFVLCVGSGLQNDFFTQPNNGDGVAIQYAYVYKGHAKITAGQSTEDLEGKKLLDLTKYMGTQVQFTLLGDPTMWIAVNPHPDTQRFDAVLVKDGESMTIQGSEKRKYILCLEGQIRCNDKDVAALSYATVRNDSVVSLSVPQGSAAVVLTTR